MKSILQGTNGFEVMGTNGAPIYIGKASISYIQVDPSNSSLVKIAFSAYSYSVSKLAHIHTTDSYEKVKALFES